MDRHTDRQGQILKAPDYCFRGIKKVYQYTFRGGSNTSFKRNQLLNKDNYLSGLFGFDFSYLEMNRSKVPFANSTDQDQHRSVFTCPVKQLMMMTGLFQGNSIPSWKTLLLSSWYDDYNVCQLEINGQNELSQRKTRHDVIRIL